MKKFFSISLIFLFFFASVGQAQPLYLHWTKFIGGTESDNCYHSISSTDSSIVFVGITSDISGLWDMPASPPDSNQSFPVNLVIGKLDSNKQLAWVKVYGGSNYDVGIKIQELDNGNYMVLGTTLSYDGDVTGLKGGSDVWLLCLDSQGNLLWQKTYGSSNGDEAISFSKTSDNGFIILATSNGSDNDVPFHYGSFFDLDWLVIKTDNQGNLQWSKTIGGTGEEGSHGSIFEANGGYYIVSGSSSNDYDCDDSSWHTPPHSDPDYYLLKLDMVGNKLWSKSYGGSGIDLVNDAFWDERDSSIVITGFTKSIDLMVQNNNNGFYESIWVVKTDKDGNYMWGNRMGDTNSDNSPYNILPFGNDGYIMATTCYPGFFDTKIFMLDSSGIPLYTKIFGGTQQETNYPNLIHYKGGYIVTGTSLSNDFSEGINLNNNHNTTPDIYISALFDFPDPLTVKEKQIISNCLKIYPNPAKDNVVIELPTSRATGSLSVWESSGKLIYNKRYVSKKTININIASWAKGTYIIEWTGEKGNRYQTKLINN